MITHVEPVHLPAVLAIYESGIASRMATFEQQCPTAEAWDAKYDADLRYVYIENGHVLGWVSVVPVSTRASYKGVAELSIYVAEAARGKGVGLALLTHLCIEAKAYGYWMLQGTILQKNSASIKLHEKAGFRTVGIRQGIAQLDGVWENTVLMEKHLLLQEDTNDAAAHSIYV